MVTSRLNDAIGRFGAAVKSRLDNPAALGEPEDQLRVPFDQLMKDLEPLIGPGAQDVVLVGETRIRDLMTRPDFAVTRSGALVGFVELKAPGKGADPRQYRGGHDREQWNRLRSLPNVLYSDGNGFFLWQEGGVEAVQLIGDVRTSGSRLAATHGLVDLFTRFLSWDPQPPRSPRELAETAARLCRLLRDEVAEQLARGAPGLTALKIDWRKLLFPEATESEFADGYAQAVTFGLLMARARGISLSDGIDAAAKDLRRTNTLIGTALHLLTEEAESEHTLDTSLRALVRVLDVVDWPTISRGDPDAWLYFYELFLAEYDPVLRRKTGSYYTPPEVVTAMVRMVDDALRSTRRFGLNRGLADVSVTIADPAVGTGTFLLGVLRRMSRIIADAEGEGAVAAGVTAALTRLIGFEFQFGPYAVAQLRLTAEVAELTAAAGNPGSTPLRLYVADTLADPDEGTAWIPRSLAALSDSRLAANKVKREEAITVVIGNPPYKEKARGLGGWVEDRGPDLPAALDDWQPPVDWGVGAHAKHLRNLYVYFWRWAAWKVFGGDLFHSGHGAVPEGWTQRQGVVCFITVAGFLNGPGFQKMRADLRRDADEIWVIDCSPEGHQPPVSSRIFQGVQQPVCIVMASRSPTTRPDAPARVRFRALPMGSREEKFAALESVSIDGADWAEAPPEWRAAFLPSAAAEWVSYPAILELFAYNGSGVMPGRTWVIAPDRVSLRRRWEVLRDELDLLRKEILFHPHMVRGVVSDRHIRRVVGAHLPGHPHPPFTILADKGDAALPVRIGYRSFDRQWILPDARLLNRPNPTLWAAHSNSQVYLTCLEAHAPTSGPAATIAGEIPDLHHYKGSFGGRVFPLWADDHATRSNFAPGLLAELATRLGVAVSPNELFAYVAAVAAHPAYTLRFQHHLKQPGLRIPITADPALFAEAVEIGREVVWLHTYGERFNEGRPPGPPRVDCDEPTIPRDGAFPRLLSDMPHDLDYDPARRRLLVGTGYVANVAPEVWAYEVSGKDVIRQWWSYRRLDRSKPPMGDRRPPSPLSAIQPDEWLPEYTTDLLELLRVLTRLVALEPRQADLLRRIVVAPTLDADILRESGGLAVAPDDDEEDGDQGETA